MRELLHIGMVHDLPELFIPEGEERRQEYKRVQLLLERAYSQVTEKILQEHQKKPFHRLYFEGYDEEHPIPEDDGVAQPIRGLQREGVPLMSTEKVYVLDVLMFSYGKDFFRMMEEYKHIATQELLQEIKETRNPPHYIQAFTEFFQDCDYADVNQAREYWIGRNIARTLQEGERGLLMLGKANNKENIRKFLPDVQYTYKDLFPGANPKC